MKKPADTTKRIGEMEDELARLAYEWRSTERSALVQHYQATLRAMIRLGFSAPLDVDSELPDELMPVEYMQLHHPSKVPSGIK